MSWLKLPSWCCTRLDKQLRATTNHQRLVPLFRPVASSQMHLADSSEQYVLLVGGFGRSRILHDYLRKRIKIAFKRIDIVQEEGADP